MGAKSFTPYTYFQCPCSEHGTALARESSSRPSSSHQNEGGDAGGGGDADTTDDHHQHTFDPRLPRANYSLYPLEYLMYCEDCHQIRCPRCVLEEIVTYYCPSCLFEVPTTSIKGDGNRCTRSCFQCPICIGPLTALTLEGDDRTAPDGTAMPSSSFALTCLYCQWMSTEIGITFDKSNGLYSQLSRVRSGGKPRLAPPKNFRLGQVGTNIAPAGPSLLSASSLSSALAVDEPTLGPSAVAAEPAKPPVEEGIDMARQFAALKHFYMKQLASHGGGTTGLSPFGDVAFGSPASALRLVNMYNGMPLGLNNDIFEKRFSGRLRGMRESRTDFEGFLTARLDESEEIARLHNGTRGGCNHPEDDMFNGWDITASAEQRNAQAEYICNDHDHRYPRFLDELRPIPVLLRTKRSKRCPLCRHIISKPEAKANNSRFRIRLVAGSYIPSISIRPMHQPAPPPPPAKPSRSAPLPPPPPSNILEPMKPVQYILTFKNPIFESVKVTLAAPSTTPGRFASKVTILCPQFEIDSNTDVWDDALRDSAADAGGGGSGSGGAGGSRGSNRRDEGGGGGGGGGQQQQAIAGKIWERGRNWVSIVVEVVPPSLDLDVLAMTSRPMGKEAEGQSKKIDLSPLREDEDIVEIPMSVRIEWETDAAQDGVGAASGKDKDVKEKRELAYWCVLGIGRIRHD